MVWSPALMIAFGNTSAPTVKLSFPLGIWTTTVRLARGTPAPLPVSPHFLPPPRPRPRRRLLGSEDPELLGGADDLFPGWPGRVPRSPRPIADANGGEQVGRGADNELAQELLRVHAASSSGQAPDRPSRPRNSSALPIRASVSTIRASSPQSDQWTPITGITPRR